MKTSGKSPVPSDDAKIQLLQPLRVFRSLVPSELKIIARHSGWMSCQKGDTVPQDQGGGGKLFVVFGGEVVIFRNDDAGKEISLAIYDRGRSFGEFSLFEGRQADTVARCEEDTTLLAFPLLPPRTTEEKEEGAGETAGALRTSATVEAFFLNHPFLGAKIVYNLLGIVAERNRSTNRLIAEKTPWVQELRRKAMLDKLTGLYNKSYLEEDFARMMEDDPEVVSLLMMKPDNFKTFNDTYGHEAGDRVLQLMAVGTRSLLGDSGIPVRFKGDVYAIVLPDVDPAMAEEKAVNLQRAMQKLDLRGLHDGWQQRDRHESDRLKKGTQDRGSTGDGPPTHGQSGRDNDRITVCIGITTCRDGGSSASIMLDRAYGNLFKARERGVNRIFSDEDKS